MLPNSNGAALPQTPSGDRTTGSVSTGELLVSGPIGTSDEGQPIPEAALAIGVKTQKVPFDPRSDDHLRMLVGRAAALSLNGIPINLDKLRFKHPGNFWIVRGERIRKTHFPDSDGSTASKQLAARLWGEVARDVFFDPSNDDHLRALIGASDNLTMSGKLVGSLYRMTFLNQQRGWKFEGPEFGRRVFGSEITGRKEVLSLCARLWPDPRKCEGFNSADPDHLRSLRIEGTKANGEFCRSIFVNESRGWELRGWKILETLQDVTGKFSDPSEVVLAAINRADIRAAQRAVIANCLDRRDFGIPNPFGGNEPVEIIGAPVTENFVAKLIGWVRRSQFPGEVEIESRPGVRSDGAAYIAVSISFSGVSVQCCAMTREIGEQHAARGMLLALEKAAELRGERSLHLG